MIPRIVKSKVRVYSLDEPIAKSLILCIKELVKDRFGYNKSLTYIIDGARTTAYIDILSRILTIVEED